MSQTISIANRPAIRADVRWRWDGEADQIIILSREDLALPLMLNPTAARIFSFCDGRRAIEDIARELCDEFGENDFALVLNDVKKQIEFFLEKQIVNILGLHKIPSPRRGEGMIGAKF